MHPAYVPLSLLAQGNAALFSQLNPLSLVVDLPHIFYIESQVFTLLFTFPLTYN